MSVGIAEIAEPTPSRPGFKLHRQRTAFRSFVEGTELFEDGFERFVEGCLDMDFLTDVEEQVIHGFD
jgi:hypothetical protein